MGAGTLKLSLGGRLVEGCRTLALMNCVWLARLRLLLDISEMESYRSYSPQDDQRSRQSDISSHSSNELPRESARYAHYPKPRAHNIPIFQTYQQNKWTNTPRVKERSYTCISIKWFYHDLVSNVTMSFKNISHFLFLKQWTVSETFLFIQDMNLLC